MNSAIKIMDALVQYTHSDKSLLTAIVESDNDDFIESTYRLFLHYGLSCKSYFSIGLAHEFKINPFESVFREDNEMIKVMVEFFKSYGGKFDLIVNNVRKIAISHKAESTPNKISRNLRKATSEAIQYIKDNLIDLMSDSLIDFCGSICVHTNGLRPGAGEKIVGSFIFFRILTPQILNFNSEDIIHVVTLVKVINRIASGEIEDSVSKSDRKFLESEIQGFQQLIARAMMTRRDTEYNTRRPLSTDEFETWKSIFTKELTLYRKNEIEVRKTNRTQSAISLIENNRTFKSSPKTRKKRNKSSPRSSPESQRKNSPEIQSLPKMSLKARTSRDNELKNQTVEPSRDNPKLRELTKARRHSTDVKISTKRSVEEPVRIGMASPSVSLDFLLIKASDSKVIESTADLRYIVLWNCDEIIDLSIKEDVDPSFFEMWKINGKTLIQLDGNIISQMGYEGDVKDLVHFIDTIKEFAILDPVELHTHQLDNWSVEELCLWSKLNNLDSCAEIFQAQAITGEILLSMDWQDFRNIGLYDPIEIKHVVSLRDNRLSL